MKNSCFNKSEFVSLFFPFKQGKKNKLAEYFSARFCDNHFYVKKEKFSMNFPINASKQQKGLI